MSKLSLEALSKRANESVSTELLSTISGGLENACHDGGMRAASDATYDNAWNPITTWFWGLFGIHP
jgi:hypothetical protein